MNTSTTIKVKLDSKSKNKLLNLSLRYGLNVKALAEKILKEVVSEIPEESFSDYENPKTLKHSVNKAIVEYKAGRFHTGL